LKSNELKYSMEFESKNSKIEKSTGGTTIVELIMVLIAMIALMVAAIKMISDVKNTTTERDIIHSLHSIIDVKNTTTERDIIHSLHSIIDNNYKNKELSLNIDISKLETAEPKIKIINLREESCVNVSSTLMHYDHLLNFSINDKNIEKFNISSVVESCSLDNNDNNIINIEIERER
jgi:hypothetical protein